MESHTQTSLDFQNVAATASSSDTTDARQRIDSHSAQPQARPPSIVDEKLDPEINRAGSFAGARPPSIIEQSDLQDGVSKITYSFLYSKTYASISYCCIEPHESSLAIIILDKDKVHVKYPILYEIVH